MYKKSSEAQQHLTRTGSASTKPTLYPRKTSQSKDGSEITGRFFERLGLKEAEDERERLLKRVHAAIAVGDGREAARLNCDISILKRHIKTLRSIAWASDDYSCLMRAIEEIVSPVEAAKIDQRKIEIQAEIGDPFAKHGIGKWRTRLR